MALTSGSKLQALARAKACWKVPSPLQGCLGKDEDAPFRLFENATLGTKRETNLLLGLLNPTFLKGILTKKVVLSIQIVDYRIL